MEDIYRKFHNTSWFLELTIKSAQHVPLKRAKGFPLRIDLFLARLHACTGRAVVLPSALVLALASALAKC